MWVDWTAGSKGAKRVGDLAVMKVGWKDGKMVDQLEPQKAAHLVTMSAGLMGVTKAASSADCLAAMLVHWWVARKAVMTVSMSAAWTAGLKAVRSDGRKAVRKAANLAEKTVGHLDDWWAPYWVDCWVCSLVANWVLMRVGPKAFQWAVYWVEKSAVPKVQRMVGSSAVHLDGLWAGLKDVLLASW
jgi:hypothetical protein